MAAVAARLETGREIALAAYPAMSVRPAIRATALARLRWKTGNETALCIVENGVLTVANERAFETGRNVKVFVDTDGESLFVDYDTENANDVTLHAEYRAGGWTDAM